MRARADPSRDIEMLDTRPPYRHRGQRSVIFPRPTTSKGEKLNLRRTAPALIALACLLLLPSATSHADVKGPVIVKKLNALRAKVGIPTVKHSPRWSAACKAHDRWMNRNGLLQHQQIPRTPLASKAGAEAGLGSVLSQAVSWRQGTPWINAPIHLMAILNPAERAFGGYELKSGGDFWNCLGADPRAGYREFTTERFFAWPPIRDVPAQQLAYEAPHTPQEKMGFKPWTITGPNILAWWTGPHGTMAPKSASMTSATGKRVPVKIGAQRPFFPRVHEIEYGYGNHAFVVTPKLKPRTKYTLKIVWAPPPETVGMTFCPNDFDWINGDESECRTVTDRTSIQTYTFKPKPYRLEMTGYKVPLGKKKRGKR